MLRAVDGRQGVALDQRDGVARPPEGQRGREPADAGADDHHSLTSSHESPPW
jgi:hypothetical protein